MFNFMSDRIMETQIRDDKGKAASYYMQRPSELNINRCEFLRNGITPTRKKRSPNSKKTSPSHKMKTPPKRDGLNITGANIRIWIHDQDLPKLEQIVWEGQGHRLLNETSNQSKVRQFLQLVPRMMTKIKEVHQAAISGDLETMEAKADQPEILLAKDHNGLNPLHRAAALGHNDVCGWIVNKNASTIFGVDRKGRTPLHYATNPTDGGEIYDFFVKCGADPAQGDNFNKTADYYRGRPGEIDICIVYEPPAAPRIGGVTAGDYPSSKFPSRSNSGGRQRSFDTLYPKPYLKGVENERRRGKLKGNNVYTNLYNKRKDYTGKRKYVDMKDVTDKEITKMIQEGQVDQLEYVVLSGRGGALREKSSWNDQVRRFLKRVPSYMEKINSLQAFAAGGDLAMVQKLTRENNKYAMGRNKDGAIALHFAAQSGNTEVTKHLLDMYPDGIFAEERNRRAPIHYAAISRAPGSHQTYDLLERKGAYVHACDVDGKSADTYFRETGLKSESRSLSRNSRRSSKNSLVVESLSPRGSGKIRSRSTSKSPSRSTSKSPSRKPRSRRKSISKSPSMSDSKLPDRSLSKSPPRNKSISPARRASKTSSLRKPKIRSRSKSKSPARNGFKSSSTSKSETTAPKPKKKRRKKTKSKDEEVEQAIRDAENEDYKGISRIILRGDGYRLVGAKSNSEEVQGFLNGLPESLKAIKEIQAAVEAGDLRAAQHLIDRREKAYVRDANQSNLLHTAAINGHTDVVRYLVQSFPDLINQQDMNGRTPLHYAAVLRDGGHILKILKMSNGDPYIKDNFGRSAEDYMNDPELLPQRVLSVELAEGKAKKEGEEMEQARTENEEEAEYEDDEEGATAEEEDKGETVESENAESEATADYGETGEAENTEDGNYENEEKYGTEDTEDSDQEDTEAAENNAEESPETADEEEHDYEAEVEAAIKAAENGEYEPLSDIVKRGDGKYLINKTSSDEDVQNYLEKIPFILMSIDELFKAVEDGETRKVEELLDRKDKAKVRMNHNANLLHVAVINGHSDTVRYLVQGFPDLLSDVDANGRTPLHYAAVVRDGGHVYKILKRVNADPSVKDKLGHTPEEYLNNQELLTQWNLLDELKETPPTVAPSGDGDKSVPDDESVHDNASVHDDEKERPITKDSAVSYYGSEEEGMQAADENTIEKIEAAYRKLQDSDSNSLLKKHLTQEVFENIKHRVTETGATLLDVINSGIENPDSHIGVYAPDAESYVMFNELFDPIIEEYHVDFLPIDEHPSPEYGEYDLLGNLDDLGDYVISTRIRCARSLEGYPFNPKMTLEQYTEVEQDAEAALDLLDGEFAGYYTTLADMSAEESEKLVSEHLLFKLEENSLRFLEAAGATQFWPKGRGIFLNSDNTFVVWVNEEDHLRVISMQKGGDVKTTYERFVEGILKLEDRLHFSHSQRLGFLNFCPTNLGTAIRASVHIRLPNLGKYMERLESVAEQFHLQVRGSSGEHSEAEDFVFDISNKRRLGLTEIEAIQDMYEGVQEIISIEQELENEIGNE